MGLAPALQGNARATLSIGSNVGLQKTATFPGRLDPGIMDQGDGYLRETGDCRRQESSKSGMPVIIGSTITSLSLQSNLINSMRGEKTLSFIRELLPVPSMPSNC